MATRVIEPRPPDGRIPIVHVHLKVVPGAARSEVIGLHGDRLRVRVSAPPESGKANRALLALLGEALGVAPSALALVRGGSSPFKTVAVRGLDAGTVGRLLERVS